VSTKSTFSVNQARALRVGLALALAFVFVSFLPARSSAAAGVVRYTITVPTVLLRDQPSIIASITWQVYKGEFYTVTGRSDDGLWVELAAGAEVW